MTRRTGSVRVERLPFDPAATGYFRWTRLDDRVLLTNDAGEFHFLSEPDFRGLLSGGIAADHPEREGLLAKGFLREGADTEALARRVRRKRAYLGNGPHLHAVITTLRCNQDCRYCHASRADMSRVDTDMSLEVAKGVVDFAMQTPSRYVNFEFQGGEPTINFDVIRFIVEYSREKNRYEGKELVHSVVTNLTAMDEEKAEFLLANDVLVCTSLDGPEALHDWNRAWTGGGSAWREVMKWMAYFNRRYVEMGRDPELWHVDALLTVTRRTLEQWRACVDLYLELGIRSIHFRPLNPFGFATRTWERIGYPAEAFVEVYEQVLDYIIECNLRGEQIIEGTAATFLKKMLTPDDPNFVDILSPEGSGTGQLAYSYDGTIYPSDEGRMIAAMGDEMFALGNVRESRFEEIVRHPTVRAIAVASLLDSLPQCESCFNAPYCGVRPLHNYMHTGDLFAQRPNTPKCREHMAMTRALFRRLARDTDGRIEAIFRRWAVDRPRERDERGTVPGS